MKMSKPYYEIGVYCITYNQSLYILDTLNGFCMQQTSIPYICAIFDDVSSDGEPEVIRKYLSDNFDGCDISQSINRETDDYDLLFVRHKKNHNCFFAVFFLKYNHYSIKKRRLPYLLDLFEIKYIAECEGDDYWIDPLKLQKQFDALENHPECTIAFCKVKNVSTKGTDLKSTKPNGNYLNSGIVTIDDFLKYQYGQGKWVFQTSGYFYRSHDINSIFTSKVYKQYPYGDEPLVILLLLRGKGYYIDDIGSCYRVQSGGYMSNVKNNADFAITQQEKIIKALLLLDDYTQFEYHQYISNRILFAKYRMEYYKGHYLSLYSPRFYKILKYIPLKVLVVVHLRFLCPPLYRKLKEYRRSH